MEGRHPTSTDLTLVPGKVRQAFLRSSGRRGLAPRWLLIVLQLCRSELRTYPGARQSPVIVAVVVDHLPVLAHVVGGCGFCGLVGGIGLGRWFGHGRGERWSGQWSSGAGSATSRASGGGAGRSVSQEAEPIAQVERGQTIGACITLGGRDAERATDAAGVGQRPGCGLVERVGFDEFRFPRWRGLRWGTVERWSERRPMVGRARRWRRPWPPGGVRSSSPMAWTETRRGVGRDRTSVLGGETKARGLLSGRRPKGILIAWVSARLCSACCCCSCSWSAYSSWPRWRWRCCCSRWTPARLHTVAAADRSPPDGLAPPARVRRLRAGRRASAEPGVGEPSGMEQLDLFDVD